MQEHQSLLIIFLISLFITSCLKNNAPEKKDLNSAFEISNQQNFILKETSGNTFIANSSYKQCLDGNLNTMNYTDTTHYEITDGILYTWIDSDCEKTIFRGNSNKLEGKWTTIFETVPREDAPLGCDSVGNSFFESIQVTLEFTPTELKYSMEANFCYTSAYREYLENVQMTFGVEFSDIVITGCNEISYTSDDNGEITHESVQILRVNNEELNVTKTIEDCSYSKLFPILDPTQATCESEFNSPGEEFLTCMGLNTPEFDCAADEFEYVNGFAQNDFIIFTKIDCNKVKIESIDGMVQETIEFYRGNLDSYYSVYQEKIPTDLGDTALLISYSNSDSGQFSDTLVIGPCKIIVHDNEDPTTDSTFMACFENVIKGSPTNKISNKRSQSNHTESLHKRMQPSPLVKWDYKLTHRRTRFSFNSYLPLFNIKKIARIRNLPGIPIHSLP